jgi:hypothetical protein
MASYRKIYSFYLFLILIFILVSVSQSFALDDGLLITQKTQSEHFAIYYVPDLVVSTLIQSLGITPADELLNKRTKKTNLAESNLSAMVDTLFSQVCDILDMQLYSYQGNIKICRNQQQLNEVYYNLFGKNLVNRESFYVYDLNAIYISAQGFRREVLGHEIAHAVISHYFVVLPSVKIQEVLASYVEYQLRKTGQK